MPCLLSSPHRTPHHPSNTTSSSSSSSSCAHTAHGGCLAAASQRQLLLRVARVWRAAVARPPRRRRPRPFLRKLQVLHRHGPRRALLHAMDHDDGGSGERLRLRPARRRRRPPVPGAGQREQHLPQRPPPPRRAQRLLRSPRRWLRRRLAPSRRGRADRAAVVRLVAAVPLGTEHAGLPELVLQREERRGQERQAAAAVRREARRVISVEGSAQVPGVPHAAVPQGQGAAAVRAEPQGLSGKPGARVHVEHRVVPRQCRHGRPRRHPVLQEVQWTRYVDRIGRRLQDRIHELVYLVVVSSQLMFVFFLVCSPMSWCVYPHKSHSVYACDKLYEEYVWPLYG